MPEITEIKMVAPDGKEICVLCREPTEIEAITPVDFRENYVDGAGQLCKRCDTKVYGPK